MDDPEENLRGILGTLSRETVQVLRTMAEDDDPSDLDRAIARRPDLASLRHELARSGSPEAAKDRLRDAIRDHMAQD